MKTLSFSTILVIIAATLGLTCFAQVSEERGIWKATPLTYPSVARLAQVQGDVRLDLEVDRAGSIISVSKIDGPGPLAATAAKEIREWRYTSSSAESSHCNLVIHYSLIKPALPSAPVARVAISTPFDVSVTSNYPLPTGNPETMSPKK
jgi:hypothetical protein